MITTSELEHTVHKPPTDTLPSPHLKCNSSQLTSCGMCCYCRALAASGTVGDWNSTRRWQIYQNNLSERCFSQLLRTAAATGPRSGCRFDPALGLLVPSLPPPRGASRETFHPCVHSFMCCLLPIISLLLLPLLAFVLTLRGCSLHLDAGRRGGKANLCCTA